MVDDDDDDGGGTLTLRLLPSPTMLKLPLMFVSRGDAEARREDVSKPSK